MLYKFCSRCGRRIPSGTKCSCIKERYKEYDRYSRDKRSTDFYHSPEWSRVRAATLEADDYLDVWLYMTEGRIQRADTVHHIIPLKDDWYKRLESSNLISLSHESHSYIEAEYKKNKTEMQQRLKDMLAEYRKCIPYGGVKKVRNE